MCVCVCRDMDLASAVGSADRVRHHACMHVSIHVYMLIVKTLRMHACKHIFICFCKWRNGNRKKLLEG
jgi:hypothetical protein